jgi:hypothetical protein
MGMIPYDRLAAYWSMADELAAYDGVEDFNLSHARN